MLGQMILLRTLIYCYSKARYNNSSLICLFYFILAIAVSFWMDHLSDVTSLMSRHV